LGAAVIAAAAAAALASCEGEKKKYLDAAAPLAAQMDRLAADVEAVAATATEPGKGHEADGRLAGIEGTIKKLTTDFTSIFAPADHAHHHANMVKALASEATGVSALRGYFSRGLSEGVLRARIEDLGEREAALSAGIKDSGKESPGIEKKKLEHQRVKADLEKLDREQRLLKNEMDGQLKYYQDNHKFFKAHLRVYKENLK
jgi:outer membrane murein-binding lipoprotein Lpp